MSVPAQPQPLPGEAPVRIRPAGVGDAVALAGIYVASVAVAYADLLPAAVLAAMTPQNVAPVLSARLLAGRDGAWVAERDGSAAGFLFTAADDSGALEVDMLFVHPASWRGGVATALLDEAGRFAATAGIDRMALWVYRDNGRARALYERQGWRTDGVASPDTDLAVFGVEVAQVRYERPTPTG